MNNKLEENKQEIDNIVQALTIANDITNDILLQHNEDSDELKEFMSSTQRKIMIERLSENIDFKSRLFEEILTHDLKAKEQKLIKMLNKSRKKKNTFRITIAAACTSAAAILAIFFLLFDKESYYNSHMIVSVSPQKNDLKIPTIITGDQQSIGISDNVNTIEQIMSYVSVNKNVVNYNVQSNETIIDTNKLIVPALFTQKLILNDGTEIIVNSCSELSYPVKFNGATREVTLIGEAYFKVAKSEKPFIVKLNGNYIKVVGTEFNVNARENDLIKTVLVEGSVVIGSATGSTKMKPNEIAILNKKNGHIELLPTDVNRHIAWLDGYCEFIDEKFSTVITELSSWYGVDFTYDIAEFKDAKLNISMEKSLTLIETFSKLKLAINISIHLNKKGQYEIKRIQN